MHRGARCGILLQDICMSASTSGSRHYLTTRLFDAAPWQVFDAWTDPQRLARWWGPRGATIPECTIDLRSGGAYRMIMRSGGGVNMPISGMYRMIAPERVLIMTMDAGGHPDAGQPKRRRATDDHDPIDTMLLTVQLAPAGEQTVLTLQVECASAAQRDQLLKMGMDQGWQQSFDKLAEQLAAR
jgi:uncharacterized protein YndB with AHSA1/START domain